MISWGETGAPGASVACTWPTFGASNVAVDQMPAAAAIRAAIAARTTILRMVSPSAACERRDCIRISPAAPIVRRFTQADFFSCPLELADWWLSRWLREQLQDALRQRRKAEGRGPQGRRGGA